MMRDSVADLTGIVSTSNTRFGAVREELTTAIDLYHDVNDRIGTQSAAPTVYYEVVDTLSGDVIFRGQSENGTIDFFSPAETALTVR